MEMAIVARQEPTAISQRPALQQIDWLLGLLTVLAEARGADVSAEGLELYAATLISFPDDDVRAVIERTARSKRAEGEKAWPALGDLTEPLERMRERRWEERKRVAQQQEEIAEFWRLVPEWMEITGQSEAKILERWPSFKGTKPR
jgi:hypothetical protein